MNTLCLDGQLYKNLIINGYQSLANDFERVNSLNVFPVPDGDTGTNMKKTMEGGLNAIKNSKECNIGVTAKEASRGMTFSARGNSGVILSQFFKGVSVALADKASIDVETFAHAMLSGVAQAYVVVSNPTEGTILTVMREASTKAHDANAKNFEEYFASFLAEARASLQRTPDLLPVLKEAGVIDSGGAGFIKIIEGMAEAIDGKILDNINTTADIQTPTIEHGAFNADSELTYGYCTEFILQLQNKKVDIAHFDLKEITSFLEPRGNSIVAFKDDDIVKVHVHTLVPGEIISYCQKFGEYVTFKMENMNVQHSEIMLEKANQKPRKKIGFVAVSNGEGISDLFQEMGVDYIVDGGQTMNPSTNDFINAFANVNAETIFVFPNNGNIIMAAKQAGDNYHEAKVVVVPTKSIASCYSAMSMFDDGLSSDELLNVFTEQIANLTTAEVTYAIRDTKVNGINVKTGDYIGIVNHNLVSADENRLQVCLDLFDKLEDIKDKEVVTIFCGKDVANSVVDELISLIRSKYPWLEVGSLRGGQDVYSFIIAIE